MNFEPGKDLLELDCSGFEQLMSAHGRKAFHGRQLHAWIHRRGVTDFEAMTDLAKDLRLWLSDNFHISVPAIIEEVTGKSPEPATRFLLELADGTRVEAVYIPSGERNTLCLSCQVGCAYRCTFCATGFLGLTRNMTAGEITGSYLAVCGRVENRITNVVFMGMGEPLANRVNVMRAWNTLTDPDGIGMSRRKVTISTVGLPAQLIRLAQEPHPPKLVFSIASPHEKIRRELLPLAGKFSLEENHRALMEYARHTRNRITVALLVADGLNDTPHDAVALHRWIGKLPGKVNLLRFNETDGRFRQPNEGKIEAVAAELVRLGRTVVLRASRGLDINAACGQLIAVERLKTVS